MKKKTDQRLKRQPKSFTSSANKFTASGGKERYKHSGASTGTEKSGAPNAVKRQKGYRGIGALSAMNETKKHHKKKGMTKEGGTKPKQLGAQTRDWRSGGPTGHAGGFQRVEKK